MDQSNLPPAAKLAALIEAGRAANPDIKHLRGHDWVKRGGTCAIGFAALGAGRPRARLTTIGDSIDAARRELREFPHVLTSVVMDANDHGASLDEIILSLREGELAKVEA